MGSRQPTIFVLVESYAAIVVGVELLLRRIRALYGYPIHQARKYARNQARK